MKPPEAEREEASQGDLGATMVYSATAGPARSRSRRPSSRPRARCSTMDGKTLRARPAARRGGTQPPLRLRRRGPEHVAPPLRAAAARRRLVRGRPGVDQRHRRERPAGAVGAVCSPATRSWPARPTCGSTWTEERRLSDPIEVLLQFAFLGVLYLFLLWVARSALRDLRPAGHRAVRARRARSSPAADGRTRAGWWSSAAAGLSSGRGVRGRAGPRDRPRARVRGRRSTTRSPRAGMRASTTATATSTSRT